MGIGLPASDPPAVRAVVELASLDIGSMSPVAGIDALIMVEQLRSWLGSVQHRLLAAVTAADESVQRWSRDEIGAALGLSPSAARSRIEAAATLIQSLPATMAALSSGSISCEHATAIADAAYRLSPDLHAGLEARVLERAAEVTLPQLRQSLRRAVISLDPQTAQERHRRAVADRRVDLVAGEDGMSWLSVLAPSADLQACLAAIDSGARRRACDDDDRTIDQRRADILLASLLTGRELPDRDDRGYRASVSVVVAASTLVYLDDEPAWLDGYGPITADTARELAHDRSSTWRRLVVDPVTGSAIDHGTARYRPPAHLHDQIVARDGVCTFPTCNQAARRCDLDHAVPYPSGTTVPGNLHAVHRRHHNAKTHGGWQVQMDPGSHAVTWISPQRRRYRHRPPERWRTPQDSPPGDGPASGLGSGPAEDCPF
jgi:hypothetical protein